MRRDGRPFAIVPADNDDWEASAARPAGPSQAETDAAREAEAAEVEADQAKRIAFACQIAAGCIPLAGTLGEVYLKQTRGIPVPAACWPASIQYHPDHRALVAIATAPDGTVRAVQRIHLGEDAAKIGETERAARRLPAVKVTNGVTLGAVVRLPGDPAGPLLIAEGPETGLSVYTSTGHETWIALGSVAKVQPPIGRKVVVISDDNPRATDAKHGQAAKALLKAVREWRRAGVDLVIATPWQVRRGDRSDFADVILGHGTEAVRTRLEEALRPTRAKVERADLATAQSACAAASHSFFSRLDTESAEWMSRLAVEDDPEPPAFFTQGMRVEVGVGKSHDARRDMVATLLSFRARLDKRSMIFGVPSHALSGEQASLFRDSPTAQKAGLRVEVWRGRNALDPLHPDYRHPDPLKAAAATMCQKLDIVNEAQSVGLSAQSSCCKKRVEVDGQQATLKCPLFDSCSYQAQAQRSADVWLMASDLLWHKKPSAMGDIAAVVVDEGAWRKGLQGAEGRHLSLSLDEIGDDVKIPFGSGSEGRLLDLRRQLLEALREMPDGPLRRDTLQQKTLLTADSASEAFKLEWSRKVDTLHPGLSKENRRAALEAAEGNRTIPRFAMLWGAIRALLSPGGPDASGWVSLAREQTKGGVVRVVDLKGRKDVAEAWRVPTLLLDALLPVELPPNLELAHHNNVAGRDEWRDVAALIVVGRTQPPPSALSRIAEALTGRAAAKLTDWYQSADAVREMADGSTMQAETVQHPDPLAEMIRWQICEGELIQIIGRARGVHRTAANPVDVLVLTDVPLPLPLAGVLSAAELTPGPPDHMIAAGGVILENPTDAALAYPFLWATRNAAKLAFKRGKWGHSPIRNHI